jgi:zinc transporter
MSEDDGLVHAILLDGEGGGRELTWEEAQQWTPEQGILWMHLDRGSQTAQNG